MGGGSGLLDSNVGQQRTNVLPLKQPILCKYSLTNSCVKNRKFCTATYCFWLNTVKKIDACLREKPANAIVIVNFFSLSSMKTVGFL